MSSFKQLSIILQEIRDVKQTLSVLCISKLYKIKKRAWRTSSFFNVYDSNKSNHLFISEFL